MSERYLFLFQSCRLCICLEVYVFALLVQLTCKPVYNLEQKRKIDMCPKLGVAKYEFEHKVYK